MKTRSIIFLAVVVGSFAFTPRTVNAQYGSSAGIAVRDVSDFYQPLAPFGNWVQRPPYGWCWVPVNVDGDWRPYANGHWLWSDGGWYWASEEPWAWACYHYGRWLRDPYYGWVWVPSLEWAPAWVSWRDGDDYVGWAPLPPQCDFSPGADVIYAQQVVIAPQSFVFIERDHFCELIRPSVLFINNTTIINKTVNITKIVHVNNTVVNYGPNLQGIQQTNPGRVQAWKAKPEPTLPPAVQAMRRRPQDPPVGPVPEIIYGSHGQADRKTIAQPMPMPVPSDNGAPPTQQIEYSRPQRIEHDRVPVNDPSPRMIPKPHPIEDQPIATQSGPRPLGTGQRQPERSSGDKAVYQRHVFSARAQSD